MTGRMLIVDDKPALWRLVRGAVAGACDSFAQWHQADARTPGGGSQQDQLRVVKFWHGGSFRSRMSGTAPPPPASAPADPIGEALRRSQSRLLMPLAVALLASEVEWFV